MFRRNFPVVIALIPIFAIAVLIITLSVEVPYLDEWDLVPLFQKSYSSEVHFSDFWAQYNEHRPLVPRLVLLCIALPTRWHMAYEYAFNFIIALGIAGVVFRQVLVTSRTLNISPLKWAVPVASAILFSIAAYENWLWGWQSALLISVFACLSAITILTNGVVTWPKLIGAFALGSISTYSFANGLLIWPMGLALLLVTRSNTAKVVAWASASLFVFGSYFIGYHITPGHPPIETALKSPIEFLLYIFKFIGGICAQFELFHDDDTFGQIAALIGILALATIFWAFLIILTRKVVPAKSLLPYAAMTFYSVGTAIVSGIGRVGMGSTQALSSRYCTLAGPLWVSLIVLLVIVITRTPKIHRTTQTLACLALVISIASVIFGSAMAVAPAVGFRGLLLYAQKELIILGSNPQSIDRDSLRSLNRPEVVLTWYPVLVRNHLSVFRKVDN